MESEQNTELIYTHTNFISRYDYRLFSYIHMSCMRSMLKGSEIESIQHHRKRTHYKKNLLRSEYHHEFIGNGNLDMIHNEKMGEGEGEVRENDVCYSFLTVRLLKGLFLGEQRESGTGRAISRSPSYAHII